MLNRNALQEAFFRQLHGDDAGAVSGLLVVRVLRPSILTATRWRSLIF